ncbi:UNVERIFIED_CONTAM: hypothetical protein GTU68_031350, partial [Idotea baltica]|nr:hypothetical protein [Idotea baltica]
SKAQVAAQKLEKQNSHSEFFPYPYRLTSQNAINLFSEYDIIVDASDNFATRYLANDAAVLSNKPLVYGAIHKFEGQVSVFNFKTKDGTRGPNYRDLFPSPPSPNEIPNCAEAGVIGTLPGIIGTLQANEIIKIITGIGDVFSGQLLLFDARTLDTMKIKVRKTPNNPVTGINPTITELIDYEEFCGTKSSVRLITKNEINKLEEQGQKVQYVDVREFEEIIELPHEGIHLPISRLDEKYHKIPLEGPVVFICRSGRRSAEAIEHLEQIGATGNWYSLSGGI